MHRGEGRRIDAYLQLKTCPSEALRGKILIDSPGFDADAQRNSTLRITDHIVDLSDLVLVFFDARHPESGSMHDTLEHLVRRTIARRDSNKFLYILNQIDATVPEDNIEDVFASWQRALAQSGLTAGCCYALYIPEQAAPIADPAQRARYEGKRDANLRAVRQRIEQVGVERAYRIVGLLEQTAHMLANDVVPRLEQFLGAWRRLTLWADGAVFGGALLLFMALTLYAGYWEGIHLRIPAWEVSVGLPRGQSRPAGDAGDRRRVRAPLGPPLGGRPRGRPLRTRPEGPGAHAELRARVPQEHALVPQHPAAAARRVGPQDRPRPGADRGRVAAVRAEAERPVRQPVRGNLPAARVRRTQPPAIKSVVRCAPLRILAANGAA